MLHTRVPSRGLTIVFGIVVLLTGIAELTGWIERVRWGQRAAWIAGLLSGGLGGLVGNQGGIRSAAMLGFDVPKQSFVATATAIGLFVDGARLPVYLATEWRGLVALWPLLLVATLGVVIGTALGNRVLGHLPLRTFRRIVALLLMALGIYMLATGGAPQDRGQGTRQTAAARAVT